MGAVRLIRIDPDKNMARFYKLDVQPNLFGEWSLIAEWGQIGSPGRVQERPCSTMAEALGLFGQRRRMKERRG